MTESNTTKKKSRSAGLLMYRVRDGRLEVLPAHLATASRLRRLGGPFLGRKDLGAWTIPKGEIDDGEAPLEAAIRKFAEETGIRPEGEFIDLGEVMQKSGKRVLAWAVEGDLDDSQPPPCNSFELEWPPRSGKTQSFPEIDRLQFFDTAAAKQKVNPAQREFIDRLNSKLRDGPAGASA